MDGPSGDYAMSTKADKDSGVVSLTCGIWKTHKSYFIETDTEIWLPGAEVRSKSGDISQRVQTFNYKKNKFCRTSVQHCDYS